MSGLAKGKSRDQLRRALGRPLRLGFVGGGRDSVVGTTHLAACRADGFYAPTAAVFSADDEISRSTAAAEFIDAGRVYGDFSEMAEKEGARDDGIEVVTIMTPPHLHFPAAEVFLKNGIDVICEKPVAVNLAEARALQALVRRENRLFCLTHCYSGYPMVREARAMVRSGVLGDVRIFESELAAGDKGVSVEPEDPADRHWRFRPEVMGKGAILGEVASHAHHLQYYILGEEVAEVSAEMSTFVSRRDVYDNAYLTLRYASGARGRIWGSYVAAGNDHGLQFRLFGSRGGLHWHQESPEILRFKPIGGEERIVARGYDGLSSPANDATRFRPGHPEGYALAFANLYSDFACARIAADLGEDPDAHLSGLPGCEDGVVTLALIEAAMTSNESRGSWVPVFQSNGGGGK